MKKLILLPVLFLLFLPCFGQDAVVDASLDFQDNDIWFTILDESAGTCKTRSGSCILQDKKLIITYGNTVSGELNIPSKAQKEGKEYTVVAIGDYGFTGMTSVTIPETVIEIGSSAFLASSEITSIDIPSSVISIGSYAFSGCSSLSSVNLPETLTSIPASCFVACTSLHNINLPETLTSIGQSAFSRAGLVSVELPNSLTELGPDAFFHCSALANINLPETLTAIPANAFSGCRSLTSLTLPTSLTQIGANAFYGCTGLTTITIHSLTPPAISGDSFGNISTSSITAFVYKTALTAYQKNSLWSRFGTYMAIPVEATGISLDKTSLSLYEGFSGQLNAIVEPTDATNPVEWSVTSTPNGAATVNDTGKVLAGTTGTAIVTATCGEYKATCTVTINRNPSAYIKITHYDNDIYVGDKFTLTATKTPSTLSSPIEWSSSNIDVVSVGATSGEVTALAPGGAVITATCGDISAKYAITVLGIEANAVTLNPTSLILIPGETGNISATVAPENTTYPVVTWSSNDETVATVAEGVVTAIAPGSATITATCGYVTATCTVTVNAIAVEKVELDTDNITLRASQSHQLIATIAPENATDKTIVWATDNEQVATVSIDGTVTAIAVGTATITAASGDVSATCTVTVEATPADEVIINMTATTLKATQTQQLTAAVPENTTDKTIVWTSDNETVAEVSSDGLVTAISVGTANITATCGSVRATCLVTVEPTPAEQIILDNSTFTVNVGETAAVKATVLPETTTDSSITWVSDNPSIATIENGIITGVAPGNAMIIVTCGDITASCAVTVLSPATGITLNITDITLYIGDIEDLIATIEPENTTDAVVWTSSNPDVASVNDHGIVTGLTEGTATITVSCGEVEATCTVNVVKEENTETPEGPENPGGDNDNPSALDDIRADADGFYRVFNLNGINVINTTDIDKLNSLPRGVYIVNKKKVLLP